MRCRKVSRHTRKKIPLFMRKCAGAGEAARKEPYWDQVGGLEECSCAIWQTSCRSILAAGGGEVRSLRQLFESMLPEMYSTLLERCRKRSGARSGCEVSRNRSTQPVSPTAPNVPVLLHV